MAALELHGSNLAEKHRNYNKLANEIITTGKPSGDFKIEGEDVENLIKIDVASRKRDLEYILQVLKRDDMLYVSKAIKKSPWLITDRQYSHIINPEYLYTQLFPTMTAKACAKLMLHVRLNLKDEDRVDIFYTYLKNKDLDAAIKWLPNCSVAVIEKEVENLGDKINQGILKRLCERSFSVLDIYVKRTHSYYIRNILDLAKFLLKTETEKYLSLTEKQEAYNIPRFGPKEVETIMTTCPQRLKDNFEKYSNKIDLDTFAKYLDKNEIREFLIKQFENKNLRCWFKFDNLKHFVKYMPKEGRFDFLRTFFIEKKTNTRDEDDIMECDEVAYCGMKCLTSNSPSSSANVYCWYRFATFETAYPDLTKLIRTESVPAERIAMFGILLNCAGRNMQHVRTVLQYYHDKHINEPFKFKIQFVNMVISLTPTHKYDESTWNILNNLFHSLEVLVESDNNVENCIEAIVVYKVLHNEPIPVIVGKKFQFNPLKFHKKKLNCSEREKVFSYLYNYQKSKIEIQTIKDEKDFKEVVQLLDEILTLLVQWEKNIVDYPFLLETITKLTKMKNENNWKSDLSSLYNKNKSWRKMMFENSLSMWPSKETCYNALKHDASLFSRHEAIVEEIRRNDKVSLRRLLRKLRTFWPHSLGTQWGEQYLARLNQPGGHKALIDGICALLPQKQLNEIITKYAPTESKINWSEDDELVLSLRKHLAKNMHLSRPHPLVDLVLLYAQGDYLQFALPSVNAILHNMSPEHLRENISKVMNAPVSLQKHGIRFAFSKLQSSELKKLFYETWKKAKNPSIRAVLFQQTFYLLCKQKNPLMIEEIWQLLNLFIDNLTTEENKTIYETLGKVEKVPSLIKGKFIMKSYAFVKTLPAKANCESLLTRLKCFMVDSMEQLDAEFVEGVILENLDKNVTTQQYQHSDLIVAYLLCVKDEKAQSERYNKIMLPILERCFAIWDVKSKDNYASYNVQNILQNMPQFFKTHVLRRKMVYPTKLCKNIQSQLVQRLSVEKNYYLLTYWKLITAFITLLEEYKELLATEEIEDAETESRFSNDDDKESTSKWKEIYIKMLPKYSDICLQYLRNDINKYFPSIYWLFADGLNDVLQHIRPSVYYECLESLLKNEDFIHSYLVVLKLMPEHIYDRENKKLYKVILNKIFSHQSAEVKMHFFQKFDRDALYESDD